MEDGATLAVCLTRAGKGRIQEAVAAFEALRYERVRAAQKTGEATRDTWHKANWDEVKKNPGMSFPYLNVSQIQALQTS